MKTAVGLGACVLDTLIACKQYPQEDVKMKAESLQKTGGGPVSNALVVASKLGVRAAYLGTLAGDDAGAYLKADFERLGVGTGAVRVVPGAQSFTSYIILAEDASSRTCVYHRGTLPDDPQLLDYSVLDHADLLLLDGNYLNCAVTAATYARGKGVKVLLDAGSVYPGIERLLPLADLLIPSAEFALQFTGAATLPAAVRLLAEQFHPVMLAVTDGKNGGFYEQAGEVKHYEPRPTRAVDTNGAGDTFHGAFAAAYLRGMNVEECCLFAAHAAEYKCARHGLRDLDFNF